MSDTELNNQTCETPVRFGTINRLESGSTLWLVLLLLVLSAYVYLHIKADSIMPLPWIDESHFLWQAVGFSEHESLFAPELNPHRTIFWMPPGYFLVMGLVFKVVGVSLEAGRAVSLSAMLLATILLFVMIRPFGPRLLNLCIGAGYFLSLPSIRAGNVARMDALLWLLIVAGFFLILRQRKLLGLCVMALSLLVHPNGVYFLAFAAPLCLYDSWHDGWKWKLKLADVIAAGVVLTAWVAYLVYVNAHWVEFQSDMGFQLSRKIAYDLGRLLTFNNTGELIVVLVCGTYCWRKSLGVGRLFFLAVPAWLVYAVGIEMWYKFFFGMGYFLLAVIAATVLVHFVNDRLQRPFVLLRPLVQFSIAVTLLAGSLYWYHGRLSGFPYMTSDDRSDIAWQLDSLAMAAPGASIEFFPTPDAFMYMAQRENGLLFSNPKFCERQPDYFLIRQSRHFEWHFNPARHGVVNVPVIDSASMSSFLIRERDTTEKWYLIPGRID